MLEIWLGCCAERDPYANLIKFVGSNSSNEAGIIFISPNNVLPSYCTFLKYKIEVEFDGAALYHRVIKILEIAAKEITKAELFQLLRQTAKPASNYEWQQFLLTDKTTKHVIKKYADLPLNLIPAATLLIDDALLHCYELLQFFSSSFLRRLSPETIKALQSLDNFNCFALWEVVSQRFSLPRLNCMKILDVKTELSFDKVSPLLCDALVTDPQYLTARKFSQGFWKQKIIHGATCYAIPPELTSFILMEMFSIGCLDIRLPEEAGVCFPEDYDVESNCVAVVKQIPKVKIIHVDSYNQGFVDHFLKSKYRNYRIFYGSSVMQSHFQFPLTASVEPTHVIIIQANKLPCKQFLKLLESELFNVERLVLLGDLKEPGANFVRGSGNILQAFSLCGFPVEEWEFAQLPDYTLLKQKHIVGESRTGMLSHCRKYQSHSIKSKQTVCSDAATRDGLLRSKSFQLGSAVQLLTLDAMGIIKNIQEVTTGSTAHKTYRMLPDVFYTILVHNKKTAEKWSAQVTIDDLAHQEVVLSSVFAGPPVENIFFFVTKSTYFDELLSIVKYATKKIHIFFLQETSVDDLLLRRENNMLIPFLWKAANKRKRDDHPKNSY